MSTPAQRKMTVDEFLVWAEVQDGRWELYNGVPYARPIGRGRRGGIRRSDRAGTGHPQDWPHLSHAARRRAGARLAACRARAMPWSLRAEAAGRVDRGARAHHRGGIASPSTRKIDASLKLTGYFSLPGVPLLIVDPDGRPWCITGAWGWDVLPSAAGRLDAGPAGARGGRG
jgi:hypothetical protein